MHASYHNPTQVVQCIVPQQRAYTVDALNGLKPVEFFRSVPDDVDALQLLFSGQGLFFVEILPSWGTVFPHTRTALLALTQLMLWHKPRQRVNTIEDRTNLNGVK